MTMPIGYQAAAYQPDIEAVGGSLGASALVAAIPLLVLFVMLGPSPAGWRSRSPNG